MSPPTCKNPVCSWSTRGFDRIWAIAAYTGDLERAIRQYKYEGKRAWAPELGHILAAHLDANPNDFGRFDVIIPSPTFVGEGGRSWDHVRDFVLAAAAAATRTWPFDLGSPGAIEQVAPTARFVEQADWTHRKDLAEGDFRGALRISDPSRIQGRAILVVDDVFTDGLRTREVANALLGRGAAHVSQLVLARRLFTPRTQ